MVVATNYLTDEMRVYSDPVQSITYGLFATTVIFKNGTVLEFPAFSWTVINH